MNLFGIMQALVSFVQDDRDNLRSIVAGKHRFVFVCRGPLVLVSVAQERQSETQVCNNNIYVFKIIPFIKHLCVLVLNDVILCCYDTALFPSHLFQLAIQLNYVFNQILSVLTQTQLTQIFEKMPGYDLRYLLQGSEKFVDNILNMIDRDPSLTIGGVSTLLVIGIV